MNSQTRHQDQVFLLNPDKKDVRRAQDLFEKFSDY